MTVIVSRKHIPFFGEDTLHKTTKRIVISLGVLALAMPLCGQEKWWPLFNGTDLTGWKHVGPGSFVVEEGMLKTVGGMGLLWYTPEEIGNAVIRVVFKASNNGDNSGVFIRIPDKPTEPWMPVNRGYEVQIDNGFRHLHDDYHCTGVLYSLTKAMAYPQRPAGEWNTMEIALDGPRTIVYVNGRKVTDYTEGQPVPPEKRWFEPDRGSRPASGYIGLQNHDAESVVYFKEVTLRHLRK